MGWDILQRLPLQCERWHLLQFGARKSSLLGSRRNPSDNLHFSYQVQPWSLPCLSPHLGHWVRQLFTYTHIIPSLSFNYSLSLISFVAGYGLLKVIWFYLILILQWYMQPGGLPSGTSYGEWLWNQMHMIWHLFGCNLQGGPNREPWPDMTCNWVALVSLFIMMLCIQSTTKFSLFILSLILFLYDFIYVFMWYSGVALINILFSVLFLFLSCFWDGWMDGWTCAVADTVLHGSGKANFCCVVCPLNIISNPCHLFLFHDYNSKMDPDAMRLL